MIISFIEFSESFLSIFDLKVKEKMRLLRCDIYLVSATYFVLQVP